MKTQKGKNGSHCLMAGAFFMFLFLFPATAIRAQASKPDSLRNALQMAKYDTTRIGILLSLSDHYSYLQPDSSIALCNRAIAIAEKIQNKEKIIKVLVEMGWNYSALGEFDKALSTYNEALKIAKELGNMSCISKCLSGIGSVYWSKSDYHNALDNFYESLRLAGVINDKNGIVRNYCSIGIVFMEQGDYPKALDVYFKALKLSVEMNDQNKIVALSSNIGIVYKELHEYDKALSYDTKALSVSEAMGDKNAIESHLINIGVVYMDEKDFEKALDYFFRAKKIAEELDDKSGLAIIFGDLGMAYEDSKEFKKSEEFYKKALQLNRELGRINGISRQLGNLGRLYTVTKRYDEAEKYLGRSLAIADSIGATELLRQFEESASNLYVLMNRDDLALEHYKKYITARDSIYNEENKNKNIRTELKYEYERKEAQTKAEQEKRDAVFMGEIRQHRIVNWSIAGAFVFLLLFVVLLFNRYRLKQKNIFQQRLNEQQKEQAIAIMETQEQERKRIAEDLHDSLGHLLSTVKLDLQTLPEEQKHLYVNSLQLLNQASNEIRDISFDLMPQTLEEEGLVPALYELADKIKRSNLYEIIIHVHDMENFSFDKQTKFNIYRIVQEAVNNILKHASAKEINIQLVRQDKFLSIMIEDDGKGFNTVEMKRRGRGLRNITARAEWLHGTIQIDSSPGRGTTIAIEIPLRRET
ncbi:MAG: tetratricopeptide repeat protein [Bacteroidia bacterium]